MDEKKRELLKKIQALAERGVGGEKSGAEEKLAALMEKYHIREEDLSDEKEEDFDFRYENSFEEKLLYQIFYKNAPDMYESKRIYRYKSGKGSRSTVGIHCTKAQGLQIRIEYDFYKELWKEEVDYFLSAFIQKHKLFPTGDGAKSEEVDDKDYRRLQKMMRGLQDKTLNPMIEEGE
jgi:hypothetical protein